MVIVCFNFAHEVPLFTDEYEIGIKIIKSENTISPTNDFLNFTHIKYLVKRFQSMEFSIQN